MDKQWPYPDTGRQSGSPGDKPHNIITPQTVMLGRIPPSIQHGCRLWARNLPLPLMIGEWGWGGFLEIDIEENTRIFGAEPQPLKWMNGRVWWAGNNGLMLGGKFPNTKGMLGGNLGDAGWKLYGEVRKRPNYLNLEFANIVYYNNSACRNHVVPFIHWAIFQHTGFRVNFCKWYNWFQNIQLISKSLKEDARIFMH